MLKRRKQPNFQPLLMVTSYNFFTLANRTQGKKWVILASHMALYIKWVYSQLIILTAQNYPCDGGDNEEARPARIIISLYSIDGHNHPIFFSVYFNNWISLSFKPINLVGLETKFKFDWLIDRSCCVLIYPGVKMKVKWMDDMKWNPPMKLEFQARIIIN